MAAVDGGPILQPKEWLSEETVEEPSLEEATETIALDFALEMRDISKNKRLTREL